MAITTSPDNLPSPTSGDPYNYVVDMAALADGTQDALTQKANMGVGTSTQRTAALSKFPDGALWYDTTTSSEWRRVAGAWVNQVDFGQVLTLSSEVVEYSSGTSPRAYKAGRVVTIAGAVKPANSTAAANFDTDGARICDVPSNMQPPNGYSAHSIQQGSGEDRWLLTYGGGGLYGARYTPGTPSAGTWFPFSITYVL